MMISKSHERGQSLVEFALLLPILLLILAGVLDLGRAYYSFVAITDAAAEGAAFASINPNDFNGIAQRAQAASGGLVEIDITNVNVTCPTVALGEPITVSVSYNYPILTPILNGVLGGELTLRGVATEVILSTE